MIRSFLEVASITASVLTKLRIGTANPNNPAVRMVSLLTDLLKWIAEMPAKKDTTNKMSSVLGFMFSVCSAGAPSTLYSIYSLYLFTFVAPNQAAISLACASVSSLPS